MSHSPTQEDREWRCMAVAIYLHRYLEGLGELMGDQKIPVTLANLAECMEASLATDHNEEFSAWEFAVGRVPEALRKLSTELGGGGFNKMLTKGEYIPVVLMIVADVLAQEPSACTAG